MHALLEEVFARGTVTLEGTVTNVHSSISLCRGEFLQQLMRELQPRITLEIGLAFGISAMFICDALREVSDHRHIVIDPNQFGGAWGDTWNGVGMKLLRTAGFGDRVELHQAPSYAALPPLEQHITVDVAFVDGWHTFDYCLVDFLLLDRLLRPGGVIVLNDAHWPSIRKVCRYILTNRDYVVLKCLHTIHDKTDWITSRAMPPVPERVRRELRPEVREPDEELGLATRAECVALMKRDGDRRRWDFHEEF